MKLPVVLSVFQTSSVSDRTYVYVVSGLSPPIVVFPILPLYASIPKVA